MEGAKKRAVTVLFLCDQDVKDCMYNELYCGGEWCNHTTKLNHAKMMHAVVNDPVRFLNERCESYVTDDKIIFKEVEE